MVQRRRRPRAEKARGPLWVWPVVGAAVAVVAAPLATRVRPREGSWLTVMWPGDASSASTALQVVATASITVITLTFSLTIVALQLASQQFSPRLLREFTRDRLTKTVLTVFVTAFVFSLAALRDIRTDAPVPTLAAFLGALLGLAALGAVLAFITHIGRELRVDTMMLRVHDETGRAIAMFYPDHDDPGPRSPLELDLEVTLGEPVAARHSGFVRTTDIDHLVQAAQRHDALVAVDVRPGDHVVVGTPMATVWGRDGRPPERAVVDGMADAVADAVDIGYERTLEQDAAFGFRQLQDIAVKAMSPGINDPVTAAHAVGHMADLLVRLTGRRLGPTLHEDEDGVGRAVVPDRDMHYYLDLTCGQLRRFASGEPTVLMALLRMLRDLAAAVREDHDRTAVREAAVLVAEELDPGVSEYDAASVRAMCERVLLVLEGRQQEGYLDRSGETRSI